MWYTSPVLSSGIASASRREGRCLAYMTSALMAPLQPVHFINDLLPVTSCRQAQPRLHCLERAVRIQPLTITPTVRPRQSSFIMLTVSTFRASCKPGLRGSGNRLVATVNRPVRYVCYAQQDPVKTAEDIINKGIDVLKQIDGDKVCWPWLISKLLPDHHSQLANDDHQALLDLRTARAHTSILKATCRSYVSRRSGSHTTTVWHAKFKLSAALS